MVIKGWSPRMFTYYRPCDRGKDEIKRSRGQGPSEVMVKPLFKDGIIDNLYHGYQVM